MQKENTREERGIGRKEEIWKAEKRGEGTAGRRKDNDRLSLNRNQS